MARKTVRTTEEDVRVSVFSTFARKVRALEEEATKRHLPGEMTGRDLRLLLAISEIGGQGMMAICKRLNVTQPSISIGIARLEGKGLSERAGVEGDLRRRSFTLTDRGLKIVKAIRQSESEADMTILSALPKADRAKFEAMVKTIVETLP